MIRQKDMIVSEVIGFTDENGRISELEVRGTVDSWRTWILLHVGEASFRMSGAPLEDVTEQVSITDLDVYAPESLFGDWPQGLESVTIARGSYADVATVTGSRRAVTEFVTEQWALDNDPDTKAQILADIRPVGEVTQG